MVYPAVAQVLRPAILLPHDTTSLTSLSFLRVSGAGRVLVGDHTRDVYEVDSAHGTLVPFARRGRGPGEVIGPWAAGWLRDTAFVVDMAQRRVNLYPSSGRAISQLFDRFCGGVPIALLTDGTCIVVTLSETGESVTGDPEVTILYRSRREGGRVSGDYALSIRNRGMRILSGQSNTVLNQPFADHPLYDAGSTGEQFVVGERRASESPQPTFATLLVWHAGTRGQDTVRVNYVPIPIPEDTIEQAVERIRQGALTYLKVRIPRDSIVRKLFAPHFYPPFADLKVGRDGRVWLKSSHGSLASQEAENDAWVVLDSNGRRQTVVRFPVGTRVLDADDRFVWAEALDSFDVPILERFAVP